MTESPGFVSRVLHGCWGMLLLAFLAGCGGGGGGTPPSSPTNPSLKLEDGAIVGALVVDANGQQANETGRGTYQFSTTPRAPISIRSQNLITSDGRVQTVYADRTWFSYIGVNRAPLTYQDLDGDGTFTQGVDLVYNGAFALNYVPAAASQIFANPVTALIPANWNGSDPVAGVPAASLRSAASAGVQDSADANVKKVSALLTAISDTLALTGSSAADITRAIGAVANSSGSGVNLLATGTGLAAATSALSNVVSTAVPSNPAAPALVTNIKTLAGTVGSLNNYEAIVQVAQSNVQTIAASTSVDATVLTGYIANADAAIATAQSNASSNNGLATRIAALRLVPFCDFQTSATCGTFAAVGRLTNFALSLDAGQNIVLSGGGNLLSQFFPSLPLTLTYDAVNSRWAQAPAANAASAQVMVGVSLPGESAQGNLLKLCDSSGNCVPYFLVPSAGVCRFVTTNGVVDPQRLAAINAMQASSNRITCP